MNILFVLKTLAVGGVETVTASLANEFANKGHNVGIFVFYSVPNMITDRISSRVHIYQLDRYAITRANIKALRRVLIDENIDVIVNQWGLPLVPILVINRARRGLNVKVVTCYHCAANTFGKVESLDRKISLSKRFITKTILKGLRMAVNFTGRSAMHYNYSHSNAYVLLSPSFIPLFKEYAHIKNDAKLYAIGNPITIKDNGYVYDKCGKTKEILYVGRIEQVQKRVDRVIAIWQRLCSEYPDWRLTIVGDGPSRTEIEQMAANISLPRITFEGFQNPAPYYKRASLLLLTSEQEGFGLVIVEGMKFGVVPIVYGSYAAVYDIIDDGKDGAISKPKKGNFDVEDMTKRIKQYMQNEDLLISTAKAAMDKSKKFSMETIYNEWINLFVNLCKSRG